jgi:hypothetical protein
MVSRQQLLELGFSARAIEHRLESGRLHKVMHGVYAAGRSEVTKEGRWMAAVLACGGEAVLSHRSAAALWGIGVERRDRIDLSIRRRSRIRLRGLKVRARPTLKRTNVATFGSIPVTTPAQTLIDIAAELTPRLLERAVNEADRLDLIDPEALRVGLDSHRGEPGVRPLRKLLDRYTFQLSDDALERIFRPIATAAGLPVPETKVLVNGFEVDFHWPALGLVVETDGFRYHRTAATQSRDALRDQTHTAAGLTTLRFSHWQVTHERARVRLVLARTAAWLR